ncbi:MAG: hypothetical protein HQL31_04050 [Planctomycetes bacterium]|nr:hypothetical protein [Planctomycetota bacterium]
MSNDFVVKMAIQDLIDHVKAQASSWDELALNPMGHILQSCLLIEESLFSKSAADQITEEFEDSETRDEVMEANHFYRDTLRDQHEEFEDIYTVCMMENS